MNERENERQEATAALNKTGMTITHGEKAWPTSSDHHPHAPHCSLRSDWLMQNQERGRNAHFHSQGIFLCSEDTSKN